MRILSALLALPFALAAAAQADGLIAYVPSAPVERTADDTRVGFVESAVPGKMEAQLPDDAYQVDILNARGNVKHTYAAHELGQLDLGHLRHGTWTLRVHTPQGLLVRRFAVLHQGAMLWALPPGTKKRR